MSKKRISLYDTTLRDGAQAQGVSFSASGKILLAKRLDAFGVDYIEGGYPLSNPKDAAFFQEVRQRRETIKRDRSNGRKKNDKRKKSSEDNRLDTRV